MTTSTSTSDVVPPAETSMIGKVVAGRYRIDKLLGEGGMGAVYLAEHTHMRKRVALKLLHSEMSENTEVQARFEREAMAASHIEHPNVASATDFGRTEDGAFFLVLEYVEGKSLRDEVAKGPMPAARALHIGRQIALALERAHESGIVHRDLKPENVMLVQREADPDFVKVLDFGIAKVSDSTIAARGGATDQPLTRMGTVLGTPEYMAPEQALGEAVSPASDLYAVGIMLYEMLTGLLPFDPPDRVAMLSFHIVAPVPPMADRTAKVDVPPPIEAVVRKLLEKDSKLRHESARSLVEAIDQAAAASGIALNGGTPAPPESARIIPVAPPSEGAAVATSLPDVFAETSIGMPAARPPKPSPLALFEKQPRHVKLAIAVIAPLAILLVVVAIVLGGRSTTTAGEDGGEPATEEKASRSKTAPADKVQIATALGPEALETLAKEYPEDPALPKQIAMSYIAQSRTAEGLKKIGALLATDSSAAGDEEIVRAIVKAAETGKGADDDAAFALLGGSLGARGVDELIEMSDRQNVRSPAARRIKEILGRGDVRAKASPAAAVLLDFKSANGCTARKELLDRVKDAGDARVLTILRKMSKDRRGCGFLNRADCWACMRGGPLDDAVAALEAKTAEK